MRCLAEPRRAPSMTKPASARTSRSLPSSDGWKLKKGSSKERREPRAAKPKTKTSETLAHEEGVDADPQLAEARVVDAGEQVHPDQAEHGVDRLAIDVVAGVAGHVVLGRLAEGEDAEGDQRRRRRGRVPASM